MVKMESKACNRKPGGLLDGRLISLQPQPRVAARAQDFALPECRRIGVAVEFDVLGELRSGFDGEVVDTDVFCGHGSSVVKPAIGKAAA